MPSEKLATLNVWSKLWSRVRALQIWMALAAICLVWVFLSQVLSFAFLSQANLIGQRQDDIQFDGALTFLENKTIEWRYAVRGEIPSPLKVIYVNIDADSISAFGNFPWNRELFAQAIHTLFTYGKVRAIGMDLVFSNAGQPNIGREEQAAGSLALGKAVQKFGNIVLAASYTSGVGVADKRRNFPYLFNDQAAQNIDPEVPQFPVKPPVRGFIGLIDTSGQDRFVPQFARFEISVYLPISTQLALLHWDLAPAAVAIEPDALTIRRPDGAVQRRIPLLLGQLTEINWFSSWAANPQFSIADVLTYGAAMEELSPEERAEVQAKVFDQFQDAIVLIGPTDPLMHDTAFLPMDTERMVPKVSVHGNMLKTLVSGRFISRPPWWLNALIICAMGLGAGSLCLRQGSLWRYLAGTLTIAYIGAAFLAFARFDLILPMVAPVGAAMLCAFFAILWQLGIEEKQRRWIKSAFGTYVSPQIVEEMVSRNMTPELGGAEVEITAFFSDIEAFSPLAESLAPNRLVELMNEYLGECTAAITRHDGTLDKYVGDAIIAIFGAPLACSNHAAAACRAAVDFLHAQNALRERWASEEGRWPERALKIRTRIGLNTGHAVVGNLGSRLRFNYTMMGDNVNLTQRIEASAAHYGVQILASSATREAATSDDPDLIFRHIDRVLVPGRAAPVELNELVGMRQEVDDRMLRCLGVYQEGLDNYFRGLWQTGAEAFRESAELEFRKSFPTPSLVMLRRCERFLASPPPEDWNFASQLTKGG